MAQDEKIVGTKIKATPIEKPEIGADTESTFTNDLLDSAEVSSLDLSILEGFSNVAQSREQIYSLIDMMGEDVRVSSVLETYAEDTVETNDAGQTIWCESSDPQISKYINYLMDSLKIDKNVYEWAYNLIKYGDVYLRLYRESDYNEDELFSDEDGTSGYKQLNESILDSNLNKEDKELKEDVNLHIHGKDDHYVHFVEMMSNPSEMFELTKLGKTMGFIYAPTTVQNLLDRSQVTNNFLTYKMKKNDVNVYDAMDFVHASLNNDNATRSPEEVKIFLDDESYDKDEHAITYKVKKGQSLLYNSFVVWRQLSLLENSVMLNRLTRSSIVRILNVDVGEMPKEQVSNLLSRLKQKIEQKSAINTGKSMQEYTNPGPIENIIYTPTHGTQGQITAQTIGGDVDPKQLTDLEYFLNKFYGGLRAPKQFFAQTDDSAGFNGGSSLSIISSRYGKVIKRIQNTICQLVTDLINLFLLDKHLTSYINKFTIRMQSPVTQEEIDRREDMRNRMGVVNDIMSQVGNVVTDDLLKIKVVKALLSGIVTDPEVIDLLQEQIDILEKQKAEEEEKNSPKQEEDNGELLPPEETFEEPSEMPTLSKEELPEPEETFEEPGEEPEEMSSEEGEGGEESYLPTPDELGMDMTSNI